MKDLFTQLKTLHSEKLSSSEREAMRAVIIEKMNAYPLRVPRRMGLSMSVRQKRAAGYALASLVAIFSSASYAAASSLPGDVLYPVKINVNERIEGALSVSPKASAEFAQKQMARRALEAEALAKEHRLDDVKKDQLAEETRTHVDAYTDAKAKIENKGRVRDVEELENNMHRTIKEHEHAFAEIGVVAVGTSTAGTSDDDVPSVRGSRGQTSEFIGRPFVRPASEGDHAVLRSATSSASEEKSDAPKTRGEQKDPSKERTEWGEMSGNGEGVRMNMAPTSGSSVDKEGANSAREE